MRTFSFDLVLSVLPALYFHQYKVFYIQSASLRQKRFHRICPAEDACMALTFSLAFHGAFEMEIFDLEINAKRKYLVKMYNIHYILWWVTVQQKNR